MIQKLLTALAVVGIAAAAAVSAGRRRHLHAERGHRPHPGRPPVPGPPRLREGSGEPHERRGRHRHLPLAHPLRGQRVHRAGPRRRQHGGHHRRRAARLLRAGARHRVGALPRRRPRGDEEDRDLERVRRVQRRAPREGRPRHPLVQLVAGGAQHVHPDPGRQAGGPRRDPLPGAGRAPLDRDHRFHGGGGDPARLDFRLHRDPAGGDRLRRRADPRRVGDKALRGDQAHGEDRAHQPDDRSRHERRVDRLAAGRVPADRARRGPERRRHRHPGDRRRHRGARSEDGGGRTHHQRRRRQGAPSSRPPQGSTR